LESRFASRLPVAAVVRAEIFLRADGARTGRGPEWVPAFPADNLWNQSVSNASVDPNSDAIINFIGASLTMHPDFGAGLYQGSTIGIPYVVVSGSPFVKVRFTAYGDESDPGPMPIPKTAPIEGYPKSR